MKHYTISELPVKELMPGITLKSAHLDKVMVTFVTLQQDTILPEHSHPHEQITVMISGKLRFTVADEEVVLSAGHVVCIPSDTKHGALVLEGPCVVYDCWSPVREDYKI